MVECDRPSFDTGVGCRLPIVRNDMYQHLTELYSGGGLDAG